VNQKMWIKLFLSIFQWFTRNFLSTYLLFWRQQR